MTAQGLMAPEKPVALGADDQAPLEEAPERQQIRRWEGEGSGE
jgi:hypothetical protein